MYPTYTPLETNRLLSKEELINNVLVKYNGQVDKRRVEKALLMEEVISNRLGSYVCCRIDLYPEFTTEDKPGIYKGFINNFNNYKRKNQWFNDLISYIWTIERGGKLGRWHMHSVYFFKGHMDGYQRGRYLQEYFSCIGRVMCGVEEGFYCYWPMTQEPRVVRIDNYPLRNKVRENLLYLCKTTIGDHERLFGMSQIGLL